MKSFVKNSRIHSSFWLGDDNFAKLESGDKLDPVELSRYQRSISHFVRILTKQNIPVSYRVQGDSHTDGKKVFISSNIDADNFDSVVGLALHEGSHVVLSDFDFLKNFRSRVRTMLDDKTDLSYEEKIDWTDELVSNRNIYQSLINYIEDRRIDKYVMENSPGYQPYYEAMYDRYFRDRIIDKALKSDEHTTPSIKSYMFRIINFINDNTRLDALPDLEKMYNLIFDNLNDMDSIDDVSYYAFEIYRLMKENIDENDNDTEVDNQMPSLGNSSNSDSNDSDDESDTETPTIGSSGMTVEIEESDDEDSSIGGGGLNVNADVEEDEDEDASASGGGDDDEDDDEDSDSTELTDRQKELLPKRIERQEKFLDGDIGKRTVNKGTRDLVEAMTEMDAEYEEIEHKNPYGSDTQNKVLTLDGWNDGVFKILPYIGREKRRIEDGYSEGKSEQVKQGISLGKRLGKKLRVRNRERQTTYNRRKKGKLDPRRIHALGTGSTNVFLQNETEQYQDAFFHLSIDASGSMHRGGKLDRAIVSAVAIAQMAEMTNINVQITLRGSEEIGGINRPLVWTIYDSRKDNFNVVKTNFKYLTTLGLTPEGLCYDAIMDTLPNGSDALKTYFINYSDGCPNFYRTWRGKNSNETAYSHDEAVEHTKKQVDKLRKKGYNIMSYFISGGASSLSKFKRMYGKDASTIEPTELNALVKSLQEMLLNK